MRSRSSIRALAPLLAAALHACSDSTPPPADAGRMIPDAAAPVPGAGSSSAAGSGGSTHPTAGGSGTSGGSGATGGGGTTSGTGGMARATPDDDAGQASADAGTQAHPTTRLATPPTYLGGSGCATSYRTAGFTPTALAKRYPLFLYFVGTRFVDTDESAKYDSQAALEVTEAMARRGFVSLSADYDNGVADIFNNKLECLYGKNGKETLLAKACAMPEVDCSLGIATWGHSQGALLAHMAARYDARVKAVWTTGYGGNDVPALPYSRMRVVNGEADTMNGSTATLNKAAGFASSDCPDDGRDRCLRADGSGWIRVQKAACQTSSADHCWFDRRSCVDGAITLEPNWIDAGSKAPFALEANADWVAATVRQNM